VFIAVGALPIVAAAAYGLLHLRPVQDAAPVAEKEERELVEA
jgi:hypothetical protein